MNPHWTSIVGMATGIIGLVVAVANHIRVNKIKRIDEWREASIDLDKGRKAANSLLDEMDAAHKSRIAVQSATGQSRGGNAMRFENSYAEDLEEAQSLEKQFKEIDSQRFEGMAVETLVRRRIKIASLADQVEGLRDKYVKSVEKDDKERDNIRSDMRERMSPRQ